MEDLSCVLTSVNKAKTFGVDVVALQVKVLLARPTFHIRVPDGTLAAPLPIQFTADLLGK